jgi:AcrR family transcriptional regulator
VASRTRNPKGAGERLRRDLVTAAGQLMDHGGEGALTIRAVARAVGAAPQSVYLHFSGREQLLWAVLRERFDELAAALDTAADGCADPVERLRARCRAYCAYATTHPRRYQALLSRETPQQHDLPPEEFPGAGPFRILQADVGEALRCGDRADGVTADDARVFMATTDLLATLHGALLLRAGLPSFPWPDMEGLIERAVGSVLQRPG